MIHPRRLAGSPANIARYYSVGDYYGQAPPDGSRWGGALAPELGLAGSVDPQQLRALLQGEVAGQTLGRWRGEGLVDHHPGWDFAVSAPKSVSIMALVLGDERILAAHEEAVGAALAYLEEHAARRRRDSGEVVHETTGRLLFARFTDHASRALDPHLHTHVVVLNMTNSERDGPMASLETRAMFGEQRVAGQVYRNELAHGLRTLGYELVSDPRSGLFEIAHVPPALIADMSRRAASIDAHATDHKLEGQAARRRSFYATRGAKIKASPEALVAAWQRRTAEHGPALEALKDAAQGPAASPPLTSDQTARRAMLFGIRQAETAEAVNSLGHMLRTGLASHVGEVRLGDIRPLAQAHEARAKLLAADAPTGDHLLIHGRTSRRTARLELALCDHLALALGDARPIAPQERLLAVLETAGLTPAQDRVLVDIAMSRDRVQGVHGVAGAGKSTLIKALADAAEPGTPMIALAPTSSAAANLGEMAGLPSRTIASLIARGGRDIDENHVLVVDEAGQLGNRQAERLLAISRTTGARLLLLGDNKQTGAIEQGKPFWLLQRLGLPTAQLSVSLRQETRSMKEAVSEARAGHYAASLDHLDKLATGANADQLGRDMVAEWSRLSPKSRAGTAMLVLDNATRLTVNDQVRALLRSEARIGGEDTVLTILIPAGLTEQERRYARFYRPGQIVLFGRDREQDGIAAHVDYRVAGISEKNSGRQTVRLVDRHGRETDWDPRLGRTAQIQIFHEEERRLARGDRIQWRLVDHELGLRNAERGTVERLDGAQAMIRWDRDTRVQTIDLSRHRTWDHGYAETVYSAQSKSYPRAYVLAPVGSPLVDGRNYYTAITRARLGVKLWTEDRERLAARLEQRPGEKSSALEGLGRLEQSAARERLVRDATRLDHMRRADHEGRTAALDRQRPSSPLPARSVANRLADRAADIGAAIDRWLETMLDRERRAAHAAQRQRAIAPIAIEKEQEREKGHGHDR